MKSHKITTTTGLTGLTNLQYLDLSYNKITTTTGLTDLYSVSLQGNPVCSTEPNTRGC